MKKLQYILMLLCATAFFTACSSDRESNPVFEAPTEFKLNTPTLVNNLYDLKNSASIVLTCSQANYSYTAPATYTVEVALSEEGFEKEAFKVLPTVHNKAKMEIPAAEMAVALTELSGKEEDAFPYETPVFVRVKSEIPNTGNSAETVIYSNIVELPRVQVYYAIPPVELPTQMNIIGSMVEWKWENALEMVPTHSNPDVFWRIAYFPEGAEFKVNANKEWDGGQVGAKGIIHDLAGANISGTDNLKIGKGGWYLVIVRSEIAGSKLDTHVYFAAPNVYLFGATNGGVWEHAQAPLFTVPATNNADFVSPAFVAAGEIRACVNLNVDDISGIDWWKSEFIVLGGKIAYRGVGGDQDRVSGAVGQKLYLNFTAGTGKVE